MFYSPYYFIFISNVVSTPSTKSKPFLASFFIKNLKMFLDRLNPQSLKNQKILKSNNE